MIRKFLRGIADHAVHKLISFTHPALAAQNLLLNDRVSRQRFYEEMINVKLNYSRGEMPQIGGNKALAAYSHIWPIVSGVYSNLKFVSKEDEKADYCFVWGAGDADNNLIQLIRAFRDDSNVLLCEDGFLKSADTWANFNIPAKFREGCSLTVDPYGFYFDATKSTLIERMLNDPDLVICDEEIKRARSLINVIVENKLTKYNHQDCSDFFIGTPGRRKVLVVDQSYGDFSIRNGWASEDTFSQMLSDAINDNPEADIIVKTHPDTMTGIKKGYYQNIKEKGNVIRLTTPVNPYSIINLCDKVYVCSTQFGFEALLANKEVHVYGMPFYAGWGVTIDKLDNPRRTRTRTVEEIFYIFYVLYTKWYNPKKRHVCEIEEAIDWLIDIRKEYKHWLTGRHY